MPKETIIMELALFLVAFLVAVVGLFWVAGKAEPVAEECDHLMGVVQAFGLMGDACVCLGCGFDAYPEHFPNYDALDRAGVIIHIPEPDQLRAATEARERRRERLDLLYRRYL